MSILLCVILAGRIVRHYLLLGAPGEWKSELLFEKYLPELPVEIIEEPPPEGPFLINETTADTLCFIKGVGPVLAARIIAYRDSVGPFQNKDDLQHVKGVGPSLSQRIVEKVLFQIAEASSSSCADSCR
ncbi:MAG: helix-hairpin-helix domain-containing protein [bacterium]|nr:helix-hairpin-helix domain-containing protein [bacterium]